MSDAEETSAPTDVESTTTEPAPPTNAAPETPAPPSTPEPPAKPAPAAEPAPPAQPAAAAPAQDSPDQPPAAPEGDSFDKEFKSIIQESQPLVLGGDDENQSKEDPEATQGENRVRTNEEEDARAMARARAERNRLKKVASVDEGKPASPRERAPEEPREKFKVPEAQISDEEQGPLRDYANQEDWQQAQGGSLSVRLVRWFKYVGMGLGVIMMLAAGWIIYSEIQRSQNKRSDGGLLDMVEKMATDRQDAEEEPAMPQTRPNLPPSQQLEALVTGAGGAAVGKDVIRNLQTQVKSIKQDLKIIKSKRNQVEKSLTNIETILKALSRVDKSKRAKSKRKRTKSSKRKTP